MGYLECGSHATGHNSTFFLFYLITVILRAVNNLADFGEVDWMMVLRPVAGPFTPVCRIRSRFSDPPGPEWPRPPKPLDEAGVADRGGTHVFAH